MRIFQLTWADYDCAVDYYFEAPEDASEEDFKALCGKLMREAALDARTGKTRSPMHKHHDDGSRYDSWVGYDFLTEEVAYRLADYGYKKVTFPTVCYTHGCIIRAADEDYDNILGEEALAAVIAHNKEVEEELDKHREERRAKRVES